MMTPIFIVEDDPDIRDTLRSLLADAGYAVREAADGRQALDLLRTADQPFVVLLDLVLPVIDGAEVLAWLAERPEIASRHRYVLLTARHDALPPAVRDLTRRIPFTVLHKPFDADELFDIIEQESASAGLQGDEPRSSR